MRVMTQPFDQAGILVVDAFIGLEPGSMGETSALACLIGAVIIAVTKVGSWRTMVAVALGTIAMALVFNAIGSATNPWFAVPFWWHMVLGGWAFGTAFMATDPVTSPFSENGKWIYGFMIGALVVLIRIVNPAYPEAMMLVILFMNVMAPVIDYAIRQGQHHAKEASCRSVTTTRYTLFFATAVCVVCALLVSVAAVSLQPRQAAARAPVHGKERTARGGPARTRCRCFRSRKSIASSTESIRVRLVDLSTGELVPEAKVDARGYDQRKARGDPATSRVAPPNTAGIGRLPNLGVVYFITKGDASTRSSSPVEGLGMWGTIYGFLSLDRDTNTVRGLTYYDQKETPGLGGEIGNPKWQALWRGRKGYDDQWNARITVIKGQAGAPEADPLHVDGLSGATVTSNAITRLMQFWLSDNGYGRFLKRFREGQVT